MTELNTTQTHEVFFKMPGFLLRRCHQISIGIFHEHCKAYDITPLQFGALSSLSFYGEMDQVSLGGIVALDRTTIAHVISKLLEQELVSRSPSIKDKRSKIVTITPKGQALLLKLEEVVHSVQQEITSPLSAEETQQLIALLEKMAEKNNAYSRAPQKLGTTLRRE